MFGEGANVVVIMNTGGRPNAGLMLGQHRRRWANNKPTFAQPLVLAGYGLLFILLEMHENV